MIKVYVEGISTFYEGEDIELRYSIYENEELVREEKRFDDYVKPSIVLQVALQAALNDLYDYREEEVKVIINDGLAYSVIYGISKPKDRELLRMGGITRGIMRDFSNIEIINISGDTDLIQDWNKKLTF